jgi:hypothetical protein
VFVVALVGLARDRFVVRDLDQSAAPIGAGSPERAGHDLAGRREELDEAVSVASQAAQLGGVPNLEPGAGGVPGVAGQPLDLGLQLVPGGH